MDNGRRHPGVIGTAVERGLRLLSHVVPTEKGMYRLVRAARKVIPREQWSGVFDTPGGIAMRLDLATFSDCCMAYGLYDRETERVINAFLRPGDHFVDGGANIGYFTLRAARRVGPNGRVDSFEPQPDNRARLIENIAANGLGDRVRVHPLALSNQEGEAEIHFYLDNEWLNHGCSTLFAEPGFKTRATPVKTARMDQVLAGTTPRLVKLDVQGAEPLVIEGMAGFLKNDPPLAVIIEWADWLAPVAGFKPREMIDRLLAAVPAYKVFRIGARTRQIEPTDELLRSLGLVNLLFATQYPPAP